MSPIFNLLEALKSYEDLPGYVGWHGVRRTERPDFAAMVATALGDQSDLAFVEGGGLLPTGHCL